MTQIETTILRTIELFKKLNRSPRPVIYIETSKGMEALPEGSSFIGKSKSLPNIYVDIATLPTKLVAKIVSTRMMRYHEGKLLAYIGSNSYPINNGEYTVRRICLSDLKYFIKCYCK